MRRTYDSKFKSRVAQEAMRGELTIDEIASKYQVGQKQKETSPGRRDREFQCSGTGCVRNGVWDFCFKKHMDH